MGNEIDRRDFIKTGIVAGAAVATGLGETNQAEASKVPFDMDEFLRRADSQLDGLKHRHSLGTLVPKTRGPLTPHEAAAVARAEELLHKSMRSLLFVGLLHDMPREQQEHEGVQQRLAALMPEMDDAYYGLSDLMSSLSPADHIDLADAIGDDPALPMRVIEALDEEGAAVGISTKRRLHFRSIGTQVAWRLGHQKPSSVFAEYVDKAERLVVARGGKIEQHQKQVARLANEAFWIAPLARARAAAPVAGARLAQAGQPPTDPGMDPTPLPPAAAPPGPQPQPPPEQLQPQPQYDPMQAQLEAAANERAVYEESRRQKKLASANRTVTAGGVLLGLAAVAGVIIVAGFASPGLGWLAGAIGVTFGVLLLIAGLTVLIIGLVNRGNAGRPAAR